MRVLADLHHADLAESLELLFTDRLGWDLYFPIGMAWYDEGYWNFERNAHGDAVARQYLEGVWSNAVDTGPHWASVDMTHPGRVRKGVTLEQARSQPWDIVLCTLTHNERGFAGFAGEVGAKFGLQAGNVGQIASVPIEGAGWDKVDFLLASTTFQITPPVPHVIYRQEFRIIDFRYDWPPSEKRSVASFVQCFPENRGPTRGNFYDEFIAFAAKYPELDWKVYGAYGTEPKDEWAAGNLGSTPLVAEMMRASRIIWHAKFWSDGYGHVIHNVHAVGRPILSYHSYYADKLAGPLMEHGVTGFDLARMDPAEIIGTLRRLRDDDDYHQAICEQTVQRFHQVVNFDTDAAAVRALLESVL